MAERLTYKSKFGDYGSAKDFKSDREEIDALRNKLGKYEDGEDWIPCDKDMPPQKESVFAKFKGTGKWNDAMFERSSDDVLVTIEFIDGTRCVDVRHTTDGVWRSPAWELFQKEKAKVIAWKPMDEPYVGDL